MTPAQYLAACRVKLGHCSIYALAKKWEIDKAYLSKVIREKRPVNAHIAFLVAITLELDPATVLADIEAQQQTGKLGEFWRGFLSRARQAGGLLALTLALLLSAGNVSEQAKAGGAFRRRGCCA